MKASGCVLLREANACCIDVGFMSNMPVRTNTAPLPDPTRAPRTCTRMSSGSSAVATTSRRSSLNHSYLRGGRPWGGGGAGGKGPRDGVKRR